MTEKLTLEQLASRHLGKAGDGTVVAPYTAPEKHDKTLLVPLPRSLNRAHSGIVDSSTFIGYEVWHAYEMSFLRKDGMPTTGILKISYPANSTSMVESKSLKLYLNSFDFEKFESKKEVENIIAEDLSEILGGEVQVYYHPGNKVKFLPSSFLEVFNSSNIDDNPVQIWEYEKDETLLDRSSTEKDTLFYSTHNLRSNCEITNQKDSASSYIYMKGKNLPSTESLTKYLISFRKSQLFHENTSEVIYATLFKKYEPEELFVANLYTRRGGISIHCIRASETIQEKTVLEFLKDYSDVSRLFEKPPLE